MTKARYSRWTATRDSLDAETVFDQLNEYMNETGDLQQAMRRLMQKGIKRGENQARGLDDLLARLAREMRKLYEQYRLQPALDELQQQLESVVEEERQALRDLEQAGQDTQSQQRFLDDLPGKVSDAVDRLTSYSFQSAKAEADFRKLLDELEQIRKLENWLRREGTLFRGQTPLEFREAKELMERMEDLRRLESQLSSMQLNNVDRDLLERLLGGDPKQDFEGVMRMQSLLDEGGYVLERSEHFELTPRGVRRVGQLALRDIYQQLRRDGLGKHTTRHRGSHEFLTENSRPYVQGDPFRVNMIQTLKNALLHGGGVPVHIQPRDFTVYEAEHTTRAATVLLLDMSWSMSWEGRFAAAKKVALAMETLVRSLHPRDYFGIVGFFTRAIELKPKDLPQATWNMGDPFTNLQDGLHLAAEMLDRRPSPNQQMIVITDGQPTAYCRQGRLYCEWPLSFGGISQRAAEETLKEAERITRKGSTINTFMLDDSPVLRGFVDALTRINKGRAFYTRPDRLGEYLLVDYLSRQRKKV
ncbi:MAG TPA: VWA domain-containing protein [Candidatus Eisenbacteria bacterium]|nr:VWA domain-containing protein [Candidatus Eisenbacteria bacterium]